MSSIARIDLRERRTSVVRADDWRALSREPQFWRLVSGGRIRVGYTGRDEITLAGTSYVGRALAGQYLIDIHSKIPGALASLITYATGAAFDLEPLTTLTTDPGALAGLLSGRFVTLAHKYASNGRHWEYARRNFVGERAGGRLDIKRTILLHARGATHKLAFQRDIQSFATAKNQIVLAGLRAVEHLHPLGFVDPQSLRFARSLAVLFEDALTPAMLLGDQLQVLREAKRLTEDTPGSDHELVGLAALLAGNASFEAQGPYRDDTSPWTWFLNLEDLFETAVRNIIAIALPTFEVQHGSAIAPRIFPLTAGFTANPDVVIGTGGHVLSIGDMKYKELDGQPENADVYQLLAHASAFRANRAFLAYPGEQTMVADLGRSCNDIDTFVVTLDVANLNASVREVLLTVGGDGRA